MRKQTIFLTFVVILILVGLYFVYSYYKPLDNYNYYNVSISTEYKNEKVETLFELSTINNHYEGQSEFTYQLFEVPEGNFEFKNKNLEGQDYYEETTIYNVTKNKRIDHQLNKPIFPESKILDKNGKILVKFTEGNFKEVDFCLKGSFNYIFLNALNFTEIDRIKEFSDYEKCYDGNISFLKEEEIIEIEYSQLSQTDENDYITISFIDKAKNVESLEIK